MGPFANVTAPSGTTYATSSWYKDFGHFPIAAYPWFIRGGYWRFGSIAGGFTFNCYDGAIHSNYSFRVILVSSY